MWSSATWRRWTTARRSFGARRGEGAWLDGVRLDLSERNGRLEVLAVESARPQLVVDAAAAQLVVREAGGLVSFPEAGGEDLSASLDLGMRSRVLAAPTRELLDQVAAVAG